MKKMIDFIIKYVAPKYYRAEMLLQVEMRNNKELMHCLKAEQARCHMILDEVNRMSSMVTEQETVIEDLEDQILRLTSQVRSGSMGGV